MDYEKKYKEALERAKASYENSHGMILTKWLEGIFPELAESDDEKIRKELIEYFSQFDNGELRGVDITSWIAWLEKQGKQKPVVIPKFRVGDLIKEKKDKYGDSTIRIEAIDTENYYYFDKEFPIRISEQDDWELVEQKPTDKIEPKFKVKYAGSEYNVLEIKEIAGITYYGIEDDPNHIDYVLPDNCEIVSDYSYGVKEKGSPYPTKSAIFSEQKPAWSEEEKEIIEDIMDKLNRLMMSCTGDNAAICKREVDFLKFLKERVQPKQEWSQNDIDMIDWLIRCCEKEHEELCNDKYGHQDIVSDLKRDCRKKWNWLESLKNKVVPQNTWKPSDAQMECLLSEVTAWTKGCPKQKILESLYNDLKKLKEE